jgi:hypothetical protein
LTCTQSIETKGSVIYGNHGYFEKIGFAGK